MWSFQGRPLCQGTEGASGQQSLIVGAEGGLQLPASEQLIPPTVTEMWTCIFPQSSLQMKTRPLLTPWLAACGEPGRRHPRRRQLLQGRSSRSRYSSRRLQVHQGLRQGLPQPRLAEPSQRGCDISVLTHRRGRSLTRREFILLTHGHTDGNAGLTQADFRAHPSHCSVLLNHSAPLTRRHSAQSPTVRSHGVHHPGVISDL